MSKAATALNTVLTNHTAAEVTSDASEAAGRPGQGVIELDSHMKPIDAAAILWKNNVLGAPVWDAKAGKYVGFFDMRDILSAVVAAAKAEKDDMESGSSGEESEQNAKFQTRMVKALDTLTILGAEGKETLTDVTPADLTVSYLASRNAFISCKPDATLADLCKCLTEKHCHRVPIVDEEKDGGKCLNIISQSALVKFLSKECPQTDLQETLDEAGLPYKKDVCSIVDTADASDAFTLLDSKRLSGIAVVDEEGTLVGNTSARDIKFAALDEGRTAMNDTDIISYLAKVRQATPQKKERYPSCHVHTDSTVGHVINLLAKTGYHRVFVVDEDIRPVGVISVADVVKFAIQSGGGD